MATKKITEQPGEAIVKTDLSLPESTAESIKTDDPSLPESESNPEENPEVGRLQTAANELFRTYPQAAMLYFTSDGYAFVAPNDAERHAYSLQDKEIETIKNPLLLRGED